MGEEVHENYDGRIHIINFGGQESINKQIMDNYDEFMKAVRDDAKNYPDMDEKEALQLAFHKIICDMIRKVGGLCIFAHPFWMSVTAITRRLMLFLRFLKEDIMTHLSL